MTDKLDAYVKSGNRTVQGWLGPLAINIITQLAIVQRQSGIRGPVCEIGVHHGRSFILLHLLTEDPEKSVAWDLFDRQEENIDNSGRGDKEILQENLRRHGCDLSRIKINTENSLNLTAEKIIDECESKPRIFYIDGGHTSEIAFNDISLAAKSLCNGGIVVLDDFFNEAWPGVADGACRYLHATACFFPVVIAGNKFILTNDKGMAEKYIHGLKVPHDGALLRQSVVFGNDVVIITHVKKTIRSALANTSLWKRICEMPIGKLIKRIAVKWI